MRCQACNAPLSIENEKCPYCGTPNPDAIGHRRDMKRFSGEFLKTRSSVLKTTSETAQKSVRIVIICVLAVSTLLSLIFAGISWDLSYEIQKWQAASNSAQYKELLDAYEEEGNYLAFAALYEQKSLYSVDEFGEYDHIQKVISDYDTIFSSLTLLLSEESWEGQHEDAVKSLCDALDYHYEYLGRERYDFYAEKGAYAERHLNAAERVTEKIENLIQLTFSFSEEEMSEFKSGSSAEKQVLIERKVKAHE